MRLYFVSYYYTITTITTVGYGDVVGTNTLERLVSIINEVVGVIIFSIIISKLANIASLNDLNDAEHLEYMNKFALIEDIDTRFEMSLDLKNKLIGHIKEDIQDDLQDINDFRKNLPQKYQTQLILLMYKNIYQNLDFFSAKPKECLAWLCPLLI